MATFSNNLKVYTSNSSKWKRRADKITIYAALIISIIALMKAYGVF